MKVSGKEPRYRGWLATLLEAHGGLRMLYDNVLVTRAMTSADVRGGIRTRSREMASADG